MAIDDPDRDYVRVRLHNILTEARCGLHPWERFPERPNRLRIDVDMFARPDAGGGKDFIDYDRVRDFIKTFPARPHTDLLETMVEEIVAECFREPRVEACRVSVMKLDIFNEAEGAGVEMQRTRQSWLAKSSAAKK